MTVTRRDGSSIRLIGVAAIVIVIVIVFVLVYLTGAETFVTADTADTADMGSTTRLSIDPARLDDTQTIRITMPATAGSIQIEPEADGALEPADSDRILTIDDGVLTVPAGSCSTDCRVVLRVSTPDPLEFDIRYDENDSEYVDDIEVDYGP